MNKKSFKWIATILSLAVLLISILLISSCSPGATYKDVIVNRFDLGFLNEEDYNGGDFDESKVVKSLTLDGDTNSYMVINISYTLEDDLGEDKSFRFYIRFENPKILDVVVEEAPTSNISEKIEDGKQIIEASFSLPEKAQESRDMRIILRLMPLREGVAGYFTNLLENDFIVRMKGHSSIHDSVQTREPYISYISNGDGTYVVSAVKDEFTDLVIPDRHRDGGKIVGIADYAFKNCSKLTRVTIGDNIESIGYRSFANCNNLSSVTMGANVKSIGVEAFSGCSSLSTVSLSEGLTSISSEAFSNCTSLESISLPRSLSGLGADVFLNCSQNLTSEENGITYVDNWVVGADSILTEASLREGTLGVAASAFSSCELITRINLPKSIVHFTSIKTCPNIIIANVDEESERYKSVNGIIYSKDGTEILLYPKGKEQIAFTVPNGVIKIGESAFYGCSNLTRILLPDGITSIANNAFSSCSNLCIINIPEGVSDIGDYSFSRTKITSIELPSTVTTIGKYAFGYCSELTTATIPGSVTTIGDCTFYECKKLDSITLGEGITYISQEMFRYCKALKSITIPTTITKMHWWAFANSGICEIYYDGTEAEWNKIENKSNPSYVITYHFKPTEE
ncbi:MAG: leucine-rich repeat domain-containing protein [Clostridia bacterium]|nr:leucine-rich repeat domain-containing protein [Clostridia bacterium]